MKCSLCKKRIWFWQESKWIYHTICMARREIEILIAEIGQLKKDGNHGKS